MEEDAASNPRKAAQLAAWVQHVRWLWEEERQRFDALGTRAAALLALDGILVGLLVSAATGARDAKRWTLVAAAGVAVLSAALAIWALRPRKLAGLPISEVRRRWNAYRKGGSSLDLEGDFSEMLINATTRDGDQVPGPLSALHEAANERGRYTQWSAAMVSAALVVVVVVLAIRR